MSSHHIIRDEQEPPILVFQMNDNWYELSEILGWSPILLIRPFLKETFELRQTKVDGHLFEMDENDRLNPYDLVYSQSHLHLALLDWIEERKCTAVNIFCNFQDVSSLYSQLKESSLAIPLIFFTENGKYILKPSSIFKKWYPANFKLEIINDDIKRTENLLRDENGYIVEKEGFVKVEVQGNIILIKS